MATQSKRNEYLGQKRLNNQGYEMEIIEYNTYDDILVKFNEPYAWEVKSTYGKFKTGEIINHYAPSICDFGIIGNKYPTCDINGKHTREYQVWSNMIRRCYDPVHQKRNPSYAGIICAEEWRYYENFYSWYHTQENYAVINQLENYALDKDIICKGNRIYAPDKCTLVPTRINNLLLKPTRKRGKYPVGVTYYPRNKKYGAESGGKNRHIFLGLYTTPEEAFNAYKAYKETEIQRTATEEYNKGTITKQCYEALMAYKVNITD